MEDVRTLGAMGGAALAGQALRAAGPRTVAREVAVSAIGLMPAMLALRSGDLATYHGVEHKAIGAYEQGAEAADATKEHDRCGSNLVAPMLASAAAGNVVVRRAGMKGPAADGAVALGSMALAVEVFAWSERHSDTKLARWLRRPGYEIQRDRGHARAGRRAAGGGRRRARGDPAAWSSRPLDHAGEPRAARPGGLPAADRTHPVGLLLGRLLQLHEGAARGRRAAARA